VTSVIYLDTSALVKLVRVEAETEALRQWLRDGTHDAVATSTITAVELIRAARRGGVEAVAVARRVLTGLSLVTLTPTILDRAADLEPVSLRSLDALHLATALAIGGSLEAVVAYDAQLLDAAIGMGLPMITPA
jgi:predicted nucleic acid-binding protein